MTAQGVSYTPATALADGPHQVALTVRDQAGNQAAASWSFTIDTAPPVISITSLADGSFTNQDVIVAYTVQDAYDQNPTVTITPAPPYSAEGAYHVVITARDQAGNRIAGDAGLRH